MKIKKMGLMLMVLAVLIVSLSVFFTVGLKSIKAEECNRSSNVFGFCIFQDAGSGTITINGASVDETWDLTDRNACFIGNKAAAPDCAGAVNNVCGDDLCPGALFGHNGWPCFIDADSDNLGNNCSINGSVPVYGNWDESQQTCVTCNVVSNEENRRLGWGNNFYCNGNVGPENGQFESACGADSACDEVMGAGSSCTSGLACENGGNPNCTASDHCDVNGHCCIDPNVIDLVTGACVGAAACNCGADGCCNGIGCIATGGDPDCDCVTDFGGTNCGIGGSCDVAAGSSQITNHNGLGVCCTGACAGGCTYSCSTGLCFLFLANASIIVGEDCCDGTQCYECDSGFVWNGVLNACMPLGGGIPDMGHSTDHGNYFEYDKDVDLVFTEGAEFLLRIAGGLALFVLILGGVYYIISGSNSDGQTRAKKVVTYAVIGLVIVLVSYVIVAVVESIAV